MVAEIKSLIIPVAQFMESFLGSVGLFYEYGVSRSVLATGIYIALSMLLAKDPLIHAARKAKIFPGAWFGLIGGCFAFVYLSDIRIVDYGYFYPPTTGKRIENIYLLSVLYGITSFIYFIFCSFTFQKTKGVLINLCMAAIITSPLQMWSLFSSSTRDFMRAPVLTILFILITLTIRQEIRFTNRFILLCSAFMIVAMSFRQEIVLYFPILMVAIVIFNERAIITRLKIVGKLITFSIPGYIILTFGLISAVENGSSRFIPGQSEDVIRMFYGEPSIYVGPFNDLTAFISTSTGHLSLFSRDFFDFVLEYCLRLPIIVIDTYQLPMTTNCYPPFFNSTSFGYALTFCRAIFSQGILYVFAIGFVVYGLLKNKKLFVFLAISAMYLSLINGLQFFTKNIFHFELISYLILFYGCYHAIVFIKSKFIKDYAAICN